MTLWKNASEDTLIFPFDLGKGKRELVSLCPGAEVEIPDKYNSVVHTEAPQLEMVKAKPAPIETPKKKTKKDKQDGIQ